jgi:hypothetical protein
LLVAGCGTVEPRDGPIAAKAAAALSSAQHLEVASMYELRAAEEGADAERHRTRAERQRRTSEVLNQSRPTRWAPSFMRHHCEMLESKNVKAAADDAALAQRHRAMAAEAAR